MKYDVVCYFEEIRKEHLHKYINFNNELNKYVNSALMLKHGAGGGPFGVSAKYFNLFKNDNAHVYLVSDSQVAKVLNESKPKVVVFDCGKMCNVRLLQMAKSLGATTMQISKMFGDFYHNGSDISSFVSPYMLECQKRNPTPPPNNIVFSNCLFYDPIGHCAAEQMSKEQFCSKYNLDISKDIFVYFPTAIQVLKEDPGAQEVYKKVTEIDNLIVKLHPNEYARYKSDRVDNKWSYDLYSSKNITVLEQQDTHWCYKYSSCGIGYQTSMAIEYALYENPFIYVETDEPKKIQGINADWYWQGYTWVGSKCHAKDLNNFIKSKNYQLDDIQLELKKHIEKFYVSDQPAYKILTDQIKEIVNNG